MKRIIAFFVLLITLFAFSACENEEATVIPDENITEEQPEKITYKDDFVDIWRVEMPFSAHEIKEFGKDLGLTDFTSTAKMAFYIELKADGTAGMMKNIDLLKETAMDCYHTLFYEAFNMAKATLPEDEFYLKAKETYGYQSFQAFLKGEIPERYSDSLSHREFFKMAFEEVKKYENSPIEEQATIGSLWAEILEEIGNSLVYENGVWIADTKYNYTWDFSEETLAFTFNEAEYLYNGTYEVIHLTQKDNLESKMTWYRK